MTDHTNEIVLMGKRLDELEQQNRRALKQNRCLKAAIFFLPCVTLLLGAAAAKRDITAKTITAEKLIIQDENGNKAVSIDSTKLGGLVVVHSSSKEIEKSTGGGAGFIVLSDTGKHLVELVDVAKYGPRLNLKGEKTPREFFSVGMDVGNGVPFYQLFDENGKMIRGVGGNAIKR